VVVNNRKFVSGKSVMRNKEFHYFSTVRLKKTLGKEQAISLALLYFFKAGKKIGYSE